VPPDFLEHVDHAAACGGLAAVGALERDRFPGDDRRRVAVELPVLVHEPGHRLRVRPDVGRGDVARRTENLLDLVHERACDRLDLSRPELAHVAVDTALGAAVGDADHGGLPGHEHRESPNLVEVDLGVEANAALVRAASTVVLNAEA
jgi:hypothetical protein